MPPSLTRTGRRRPAAKASREGQPPGFWARLSVLVADPATWRTLMWITVDTPVGWLLALTPAGLLAWGLFGVALGLLTAPWLLCRYGALARSLLAPVQSTKPQIN